MPEKHLIKRKHKAHRLRQGFSEQSVASIHLGTELTFLDGISY